MPQILFLEQNKQLDSKNQMQEQILKNNKNNYMKEKNRKGDLSCYIPKGIMMAPHIKL